MDSYLEHLQRELEDATGSATDAGLAQAPAGKWSAAQILEHLLLTYQNTNRGLAKCLAQGAPLATRATLKHRLAALLVVNLGHLPGGRKAPERVTPRGMLPEEVQQAIEPELQKMDSGLDACERRFGARTKIMDLTSGAYGTSSKTGGRGEFSVQISGSTPWASRPRRHARETGVNRSKGRRA